MARETGAGRIVQARIWTVVSLISAVLAGLGIAPAIHTALRDLRPEFAGQLFVGPTILMACLLLAALAARSIVRILRQERSAYATNRRTVRDFVVSVTFLGIAAAFVVWESDNLFSWRAASWLEPATGVEKRVSILRGVHIITLKDAVRTSYGRAAATLPLPVRLRSHGGRLDVAFRSMLPETSTPGDDCGDSASPVLTGNETRAEAILYLPGGCSQWRESSVELEAGVERLQIGLESRQAKSANIAIVFTGKRVRFELLWIVVDVLSFAALIVLGLAALSDPGRRTALPPDYEPEAAISWKDRYAASAAASVLLFLVVANLGVYTFVASERTIYTWDFGGHWMSAVNASRALTDGVSSARTGIAAAGGEQGDDTGAAQAEAPFLEPGFLATLVRNIRYTEYNVSPAIPLAVPMALTAPTRMAYELSIVNLYALAALCGALLLLWELIRRGNTEPPVYWPVIPAVVILCFSAFWVPVVRGYIGAVVVPVNLFILWLYLRRPMTKQPPLPLILIGVLLASSVILRRWNAIWVVSFFAMLAADALLHLLRERQFSLSAILATLRPILITGASAAGVLAIAAWPLVVTMSTTDYSDIYSAYDGEGAGLIAEFRHFVRTFGVGLIAFVAAAAAFLWVTRRYRRIAILLSLQLLVGAVYFSSIQEMGPHHMWILMPAAFTLLSLAAVAAISMPGARRRAIAIAVSVLFIGNGVASNIAVFLPSGGAIRDALVPIVPNNRRVPLVRHDIAEFGRLAAYLDEEIGASGPGRGIYVLSSSDTFNAAHLGMLEDSTGLPFRARNFLLRTAAVDKRDGFPRELLRAELFLVGWPHQFNVPPEDQHVVSIPATMLMTDTGIGRAFHKLPEVFTLRGGVEVHVFRRVRANSDEEIESLSTRLRVLYPDRPYIYRP